MLEAYAFQGRRDGMWARLRAQSARVELVAEQEVWTLSLREPTDLDGIRIVRRRTGRSLAPGVDELTLLHAGRPYVWLWPDSFRPTWSPGRRAW